MSPYQNKAIWLDSQGQHVIRTFTEKYTPTGSQSLVKVQYSAINPADTRHYFMGMSEYVAGYEFVGTVAETGPEARFKVGTEVFGHSFPGDHRPAYLGAHQEYLIAEEEFLYEKPADLDPITAVTLPVGVTSSADALFNMMKLGFPAAGLAGEESKNVPLLIWGGSSVLGQATMVLAKAAGCYPIFTTASPAQHEALMEMGATQCFDYRSPTVVEDIRTAMKGYDGKLTHVFDTICAGLGIFEGLSEEELEALKSSYSKSSPGLSRQCCDPDTPESELRLSSSLPVTADPTWKFCLSFRNNRTVDMLEGAAGWDAEERKRKEEEVREWGSRIDAVIHWVIANHATEWKAPRSRVVNGAEEGVQAIRDVWGGKMSREKIVISRPL